MASSDRRSSKANRMLHEVNDALARMKKFKEGKELI
jgi:hypothetical protein